MYGSTKRADEMFFESLKDGCGAEPRVRVVIVEPGVMDTDMQTAVRMRSRKDNHFPGRERLIARYDLGELPSPVDVAANHHRAPELVLQPGMLTLAESRFGVVRGRGQPPSIMDGCVD